ncbi:uncharacterized protein [Macrobrachium rosenbergii]|uniref:uncharacterized protein n=1 Tax=Macrobrachium rosenbergii TaxID=79674 RepID=UPI0034D405D5
MDGRSNTEFLVDTRECKLFMPASPYEQLNPTKPINIHESTASGAPLKIYGRRTMKLPFIGNEYSKTFITADIMLALLGADFLKEYNLLVDVVSKQLIPKTIHTSSPQQKIRQTILTASATPPPEISYLQQEFPDVFKDGLQHDLTKPAKHNIQHHIKTEGSLFYACFRSLASGKLV